MRRQERLKVRASARLLQDELWAVQRGLRELIARWDEPSRGDAAWPRPWLNVGERAMSLWYEHQGRLASALDSRDWRLVSRAFAAVTAFRQVQLDPRYAVQPSGGPLHQSIIQIPYEVVTDGVVALGRLSGTLPSQEELAQSTWADFLLDEGRRSRVTVQRAPPEAS
jgi:hypothetical protein